MSTTQQDKPGSKPRQRSRKAEQRGQKPDQQQSPRLDRNEEQIGKAATATDAAATGAAAIGEAAPAEVGAGEASTKADAPLIGEVLTGEVLTGEVLVGQVAPADAPSINPGAPADNGPIGIQSIANAYSNYANKSWLETGSFVGKLMGARSLDKAIEVEIEFARQAYADLVAESLNICELYCRLARQSFNSWQGFALGTQSR